MGSYRRKAPIGPNFCPDCKDNAATLLCEVHQQWLADLATKFPGTSFRWQDREIVLWIDERYLDEFDRLAVLGTLDLAMPNPEGGDRDDPSWFSLPERRRVPTTQRPLNFKERELARLLIQRAKWRDLTRERLSGIPQSSLTSTQVESTG